MSMHNHFPAGLKCIMDLCACRTHLSKILHLAELIFWIDVFQTTHNSPAETHSCGMWNLLAETDMPLWNVELTCWNTFLWTWNSPVETEAFLWNVELTCWDTFPWNAELTCWKTFLWNVKLTCWNTHIPVECRTNVLKQTHSCAMYNIPAGLDFAPGTGYVFPAVLQKCSPHSTHQLRLNSDALPSESLVHGSTVLPLPVSYALTDLAPLRVPNQSHRSSNTTKNTTACAAQ